VYQIIDELDKNHSGDNNNPTSVTDGRMYENPGGMGQIIVSPSREHRVTLSILFAEEKYYSFKSELSLFESSCMQNR